MTQDSLFPDMASKKELSLIELFKTYPQSKSDVHLFARLICEKKLPHFAQMDTKRQEELIDLMYEFGSLDRKRRKLVETHPML